MKAKAKFNIKYNGAWYANGDVIDVADADKFEMADYCDFDDKFVPETEEFEPVAETDEAPKRGRRKKN